MGKKTTGEFYQGYASTNTGIKGTNIFSIGENLSNFSVQTNMEERVLRDIESNLNGFSQPITLDTLNVDQTTAQTLLINNTNIYLNGDKSNIKNYAYFGSLVEFIRVSVEQIILNFPASLYISNESNQDIKLTVLNYNYDKVLNKAYFNIPVSAIINKYNLIYTDKSYLFSSSDNLRDLNNYLFFSIWNFENEYPLIGFTGSTDTNNYLTLEVKGDPFPNTANGQLLSKYHIKPNYQVYETFLNGLDDFPSYLLNRETTPRYSSIFKELVQGIDGNTVFVDKIFIWKTSDGYNLDYDTFEYEEYFNSLLELGNSYDNYKTNLISRFLTTTSIKEFDTPDNKADKLLKIYGREFDEIKKFIDGLANIDKITYNKKDNIPDQLVKNLAKTLGWGTFTTVDENDLIKSFLGEDNKIVFTGQSKNLTPVETDIELWRRLVINSAFLFKSKGTRNCIDFLFKIIGAPNSLIDFNEYVYLVDNKIDINKIFNNSDLNYPFDEEGYPKIPSAYTSDYYFQMKGGWRNTVAIAPNNDKDIKSVVGLHTGDYDNGKLYFDAFAQFDDLKGFELQKTVDNVKSWTYENNVSTRVNYEKETDYEIKESKLVLNTKEVEVYLDPAKAIEYDVYKYNFKYNDVLNSDKLPYPYPNIDLVKADVFEFSFIQYVDFIYSRFINVKNRKVITDNFGGGYPTLYKLYYDYFRSGELYAIAIFNNVFANVFTPTVNYSNSLDYTKVKKYIDTIDSFWLSLLDQFIPSTTIWQGGKRYRNTIYDRQKYPYKHGINDGSEFATKIKEKEQSKVSAAEINGGVNLPYIASINNRVKVDKSFSSTIYFPDDLETGKTNITNILRVKPFITGSTTVFSQPVYYMEMADKIKVGTTEPITHNVSNSQKELKFIFTANTSTLKSINPQTKFKYKIFPYDYLDKGFSSDVLYNEITDNDFIGQTGDTLTLDKVLDININDGDYLVKGSFLTTGNTYYELGYNFTPSTYTIDTEAYNNKNYYEYNLYEKELDYWFSIVSNPKKPLIDVSGFDTTYQSSTTGLTLVNYPINVTENNVTDFLYDDKPTSAVIIVVNGSTLRMSSNSGNTDGDYWISNIPDVNGIKIQLINPLYNSKNDTLSIIYLKNEDNSLISLSFESQVVNIIPSGTTDAQKGSKIYYNTATKSYEYYTSFDFGTEVDFNKIIVSLNGNILTKNVDYIDQVNNINKLLLLTKVNSNDIIIIYYPSQNSTPSLYLKSKNVTVNFDAITGKEPGIFTVQITNGYDVNFKNVTYNSIVNYISNIVETNNIYNVQIGAITVPNKTFLLRVKSEKYFTNLLGEIITTSIYSDVIIFKTDNRVLK